MANSKIYSDFFFWGNAKKKSTTIGVNQWYTVTNNSLIKRKDS